MNQGHRSKKIFVLDTNVLMHDPTSIFRFHEHDIYLPMMVLEELDQHKTGHSENARNVRQVSRFISELLKDFSVSLSEGVPIIPLLGDQDEGRITCSGRLFFQTETLAKVGVNPKLDGKIADNKIIRAALSLREHYGERVILVSKDINMRIKASIVGLSVEDYFNDQIIDDVDLLPNGYTSYEDNFWEHFQKDLESWTEAEGRSFYRVKSKEVSQWAVNQGLFVGDEKMDYIVRSLEDEETAIIEPLKDYRNHEVWGVTPRNKGQNFALNILLDPEIDFITLLGGAGTGKTFLTLAVALNQVIEEKRYEQVIMTRATVPLGDDIGFLPGTEEEKMTPWMGALMDNLEALSGGHSDDWQKGATSDLLAKYIKINSLNFMRGRTFLKRFIIIDEAQNLTSKQMKALITRAGEGTKVVCLGNIGQIDTPYLAPTTSGLTYVVAKFQSWSHSAHITLKEIERSRLAQFASLNL